MKLDKFYILQQLKSFKSANTSRLVIALSGGIDSVVLLHLLHTVRQQLTQTIIAIHINHNLHTESASWSNRCAQLCTQLNIDFKTINVKVNLSNGESLEAMAREARYQAFREIISTNDYLLTAHHINDQTETFLLQLFRGSGVKGLSAMPKILTFGHGKLLRPLLEQSRANIIDYAKQYQLTWIEDPSNTNTNFDRNFLRHQILPNLNKRWPALNQTVLRSSHHMAEAQTILDDVAQTDLDELSHNNTLNTEQLENLSHIRQKNLIRFWIRQSGYRVPSDTQLREVINNVIIANSDKMPVLTWQYGEIRRYNKQLFIMPPLKKFNTNWQAKLPINEVLALPANIGNLVCNPIKGRGIKSTAKQITVKFRQGGEHCLLPNKKHHQFLKKLFQEHKIKPWQRDRIPLLFINGELAAVVGLWICQPYNVINKDEMGMNIILEPNN